MHNERARDMTTMTFSDLTEGLILYLSVKIMSISPPPSVSKIGCNHLKNVMATLFKCGHCPTQLNITCKRVLSQKGAYVPLPDPDSRSGLGPYLIGMSAHVKINLAVLLEG